MPIPFKDLAADQDPGIAGYLKFVDEEDDKGIQAALFLVSSRGAPLDYCFTRVDVHNSFLWRQGDARRNAVTALAKVLFEGTSRTPDLILSLAEEVPPRVFADDIALSVPLCRISIGDVIVQAASEESETLTDSINLVWATNKPAPDSEARKLLDALLDRQLLREPFERAALGLEEAFRT
jgi:hypothetical protein